MLLSDHITVARHEAKVWLSEKMRLRELLDHADMRFRLAESELRTFQMKMDFAGDYDLEANPAGVETKEGG